MPVVLKAVHFMGFIRFDTTAVNQAFVFEFRKYSWENHCLAAATLKEFPLLLKVII